RASGAADAVGADAARLDAWAGARGAAACAAAGPSGAGSEAAAARAPQGSQARRRPQARQLTSLIHVPKPSPVGRRERAFAFVLTRTVRRSAPAGPRVLRFPRAFLGGLALGDGRCLARGAGRRRSGERRLGR